MFVIVSVLSPESWKLDEELKKKFDCMLIPNFTTVLQILMFSFIAAKKIEVNDTKGKEFSNK